MRDGLWWCWLTLAAILTHPWTCLFVGGGLGTWARFGLAQLFTLSNIGPTQSFSVTFVINVTGSFLLGCFFYAWKIAYPETDPRWYLALGTGFCGGYTTFSTFSVELFQLVKDDRFSLALAYACASVLLSFASVFAACLLMRWLCR